MLYVGLVTTTRWSVLLFLRRLFGVLRAFRLAVYAAATLVGAVALTTTVLFAQQCAPERNDPRRFGCIDVDLSFWVPVIPGIAADLLIVALPLPVVWRLQLSRRRRAGLVCVFLLGLL